LNLPKGRAPKEEEGEDKKKKICQVTVSTFSGGADKSGSGNQTRMYLYPSKCPINVDQRLRSIDCSDLSEFRERRTQQHWAIEVVGGQFRIGRNDPLKRNRTIFLTARAG